MTCSCKLVNVKDVSPGWGCCQCHTYNGMQRKVCREKGCGHPQPKFEVPSTWKICPKCGGALKRGEAILGTMAGRLIADDHCPVEGCDGIFDDEDEPMRTM